MLEAYTNFSIDIKMRLAKDPRVTAPSVREEVEAREGSLPSCPQVVDEILVSQSEREAAEMRDEALGAFKDQTDRPLEWYVEQAKKQKLYGDKSATVDAKEPEDKDDPGEGDARKQ
jgi:hypothetical protein